MKRLLASVTDQELTELYYGQGLTQVQISTQFGCSKTTILRRMQELGVPTDKGQKISKAKMGHEVSQEARHKLSQAKKGQRSSPNTEFKKGMVPWNVGVPMSPEAKAKMVAKKKGTPAWNKGLPLHVWMTEESNERRKIRVSGNNPRYWLGKKRPELNNSVQLERLAKGSATSWANPERRDKRIQATLKALNRHPTRLESRLIKIAKEYKLPYQYTGDGSVILAGLNPDFTNFDGAKKLIEIFGVIFHNPAKAFRKIPLRQQEPYRKAIYASLGFDCLVLWDDDMKKMSDEEIADRIRKFTKARHKPTAQLIMEVT